VFVEAPSGKHPDECLYGTLEAADDVFTMLDPVS
jgi:hypothetical protein